VLGLVAGVGVSVMLVQVIEAFCSVRVIKYLKLPDNQ
jgi:hypothetical protein